MMIRKMSSSKEIAKTTPSDFSYPTPVTLPYYGILLAFPSAMHASPIQSRCPTEIHIYNQHEQCYSVYERQQ